MIDKPLSRDEMSAAITGQAPVRRVPMVIHLWVHAGAFQDRQAAVTDLLNQYPMDVQLVPLIMPDIFQAPPEEPEYRWVNYSAPVGMAAALDAAVALEDWSQLDGVIEHFPNPQSPRLCCYRPEPDGRYRLAHWWFCLFERHWSLRGMTNALMDYYTNPDEVHRLFRTLTDFYITALERAKYELGADAIFTSDDLGTQTAPFFSPAVFREFYKPYYREIICRTHELGMHFWLHVCGNVEPFMTDFVDIGLDVLHPIQKYTMDWNHIASTYGSKLCIWAGMDVQQTIPWGTPQAVSDEVRLIVDTFYQPGECRLIIGAGNGINEDCPVENLEAFLDESLKYGHAVTLS